MVEKEINMSNESKLLGIQIPPQLIYFWEEKGMKPQRKQGPEGDLSYILSRETDLNETLQSFLLFNTVDDSNIRGTTHKNNSLIKQLTVLHSDFSINKHIYIYIIYLPI